MRSLAILLFGLSGATAQAQDCASRGLSTVETGECLVAELARADTELNAIYQAAVKSARDPNLEPKVRQAFEAALRESQRRWIAFRDADCRELVRYEWYGGSGAGNASASCLVETTRARSKDLKERYQGR